MLQKTLTFIKPDTVSEGNVGNIISIIEKAGFKLLAAKMVWLTKEDAGRFYEVHKGTDFYEGLKEYASSGPIFVLCLEKENAIEDLRGLTGATDPKAAEPGTIRALYGHTIRKNAVHSSDRPGSALKEIKFFFPELT